jgi:hypothetical protein
MKFNLISVVTMGGKEGNGATISSAGPFDDLEACEAAKVELRKYLKTFSESMSEGRKPGEIYGYHVPSSYIEKVDIFCSPVSSGDEKHG